MPERSQILDQFLNRAGWGAAVRSNLAGDASARRYVRLKMAGGGSAVLMDADPAVGEDTRPFYRVADYLRGLGFSAPEILFADVENGLLLLEDLGDAVFARLIEEHPAKESALYEAATDLLLTLHSHRPPDWLAKFTPKIMAEQTGFVFRWYMRGIGDPDEATKAESRAEPLLRTLLETHATKTDVMILRDYHSENTIWLPDRQGVARVGLLDFQDALAGHRAYDLISFLQDVRRDVPRDLAERMIERYADSAGLDLEAFSASCAVLGVQRNLRILGVFARLSLHAGKTGYINLIPRVWGHVAKGLEHPALAPLRDVLLTSLPRPTTDNLRLLKERCATIPTP